MPCPLGVAVAAGVADAAGVAVGAAVGEACELGTGVTVACCAVGLGLVVAGDVQPLIDTRTRAPIKSKGSAYLSGVLIYRFIIRVIGFILHPQK